MIAFILAKIESGRDREVLGQILKMGTKRVYPTYGVFDLIIEVEFDNAKELDDYVFNKLRRIEGVKETETMICSELLMWEMGINR